MSTKTHHIQSLGGINDFRSLLDLVKNHKKYKEVLDELEAVYTKANDQLELAGGAEQALRLKTELEAKERALKVDTASFDAERLAFNKGKVRETRDLAEQLKSMEEDKKLEWKRRESDITTKEKTLESRLVELSRKASEVKRDKDRAENLMSAATKLRDGYQSKIDRLKAAAKGL